MREWSDSSYRRKSDFEGRRGGLGSYCSQDPLSCGAGAAPAAGGANTPVLDGCRKLEAAKADGGRSSGRSSTANQSRQSRFGVLQAKSQLRRRPLPLLRILQVEFLEVSQLLNNVR